MTRILGFLAIVIIVIAAYFIWDKSKKESGQMSTLPPVVLKSPDKIYIYSKSYCPYCAKAKELLQEKSVLFEEIEITNDKALHDELKRITNQSTVPYIFIYGEFIGGFSDLEDLDHKGKLDQMLKK